MTWKQNGTSFSKVLMLTLVSLALSYKAAANEKLKISSQAGALLNKFCIDCHESDNVKGGMRLDNLSEIPLKARMEVLNKVEEQLFSLNMPPKKKKQPSEEERINLLNWVAQELNTREASTLESKLKLYRYGNLVPHEKLFSGEVKETPYTVARYWRINEFIYNERVRNVFGKDGLGLKSQDHSNTAGQGQELDGKIIIGLPIVFNLPEETGVTYFDTATVGGSNFMALKKNAEWIVEVQLRNKLKEMGEFKYPEKYLTTRPRYRDQMYPEYLFNIGTPAPFIKVLSSKSPSEADISAAINFQFERALQRQASPVELKRYLTFTRENIKAGGHIEALKKTLTAILMEPEFFYRSEIGEKGQLSPREGTYAISYALTDWVPDATLMSAADSGKLKTKADYEREVRRILNDDKIAKPRIMRFFRDYFGYIKTRKIFKEDDRFEGVYNPRKPVSYKFVWNAVGTIIDDADLFVEHILKQDKDVLNKLLTSNEFFAGYKYNAEYERKSIENDRAIYKFYLASLNGKKSFSKGEANKLKTELGKKFEGNHFGKRNYNPNAILKKYEAMFGPKADKTPALSMPGPSVLERFYGENSFDPKFPTKVKYRMGILTHPAWLIAHAHNCHTDPVVRGKWIQEKLLGGFIPEVPITVDAAIPEDHDKTIRERFAVSEAKDCWGCHKKMNPLGYTLENFDDFGRYRTLEDLEHEDNIIGTKKVVRRMLYGDKEIDKKIYKTKPVDASGFLEGTGDKNLDGEVKNYQDLISRLARSDRVRQVFIRNVFRYFMGRNEMLSDSKTLIEADKAYLKSGGSFKELLVSILSSDSFINRKDPARQLSRQ